MKRVDVVVVGAGLSGLVASTLLNRAGLSVLCLEARPRAGGRALSVHTTVGPVDLGATWFWPGEREIEVLTRRLDVATFDQHLAGDALLEQSHPGHPGTAPGQAAVQRVRGNPVDVPSYRFARGAGELIGRLADQLPVGVLHLGTPVTSITESAHGVVVRCATAAPGLSEVTAEHVVLALPPSLAVSVIDFPGRLHANVATVAARTAVWMGETVKAVAVYDTPFWRAEGLAGSAISYRGPFRELHDMSGADGDTAALFGFAPASELRRATPEQVQHAFVDQLVRLFGSQAADAVAVHAQDWSKEQWTTPPGSSSQALATTATFGHPVFGTANPSRRILWASTETADVHAGHLEGAIQAATRAAGAILAEDATLSGYAKNPGVDP